MEIGSSVFGIGTTRTPDADLRRLKSLWKKKSGHRGITTMIRPTILLLIDAEVTFRGWVI
jgi:hypothetical protein